VDRQTAWAEGTYEYRAMGAAVISRTDLFRQSDFHRDRRPPPRSDASFIGEFASLGQMNEYLRTQRRHRFLNLCSFSIAKE
jgi:hypothetical protein